MPKAKIKWNTERALSLTAMGMSFVTLLIFIYQTNLMSRQNYLSILPYVQFSILDHADEHSFAFSLKNHGIGPAILESVILEYKGERYDLKDYQNELHAFLASRKPGLDSISYDSYGSLDRGIAIPANTTYIILYIKNNPEDYRLLTGSLDEMLANGLKYEIVYRSIQDERWMIRDNSVGPQKLD